MRKIFLIMIFINSLFCYSQNNIKLHKYTSLISNHFENKTVIKIINDGIFPVTVTIDPVIQLEIITDIFFPYTGTINQKSFLEFEIKGKYAIEKIKNWIYLKTGSININYSNNNIYIYPFYLSSNIVLSQNINGGYTHKGEYKYAIDWKMDEGTPIFAARNGTVVDIESSFDKNGLTDDYLSKTNYILILHDDNTIAEYIHLKKDGINCKIGNIVKQGDLIGYSGNTGFSSGPHLHFCVHKTLSGTKRESIKIKFKK